MNLRIKYMERSPLNGWHIEYMAMQDIQLISHLTSRLEMIESWVVWGLTQDAVSDMLVYEVDYLRYLEGNINGS